jgi:hypothetical protein
VECAHDKRTEAKTRAQVDADQLVEEGKWLSPADQAKLSTCLKQFFTRDCLNPTGPVLTDAAWRFQGHLLLHLFNDNVIAMPRSEVLGSLRARNHLPVGGERAAMDLQGKLMPPLAGLHLVTLFSAHPDGGWAGQD